MSKTWNRLLTVALWTPLVAVPALAGPTVVPTCEGQIGDAPAALDRLVGFTLESIRGSTDDIFFADLVTGLVIMGPVPGTVSINSDVVPGMPTPMSVDSFTTAYQDTFNTKPRSSRIRNAADDGDFAAVATSSDGTNAGSQRIDVRVFDENLGSTVSIGLDNIPSFPDPTINNIGVATDNQGRVTVAYTEIFPGNLARVRAVRLDGLTGLPIDPPFDVTGDGRASGRHRPPRSGRQPAHHSEHRLRHDPRQHRGLQWWDSGGASRLPHQHHPSDLRQHTSVRGFGPGDRHGDRRLGERQCSGRRSGEHLRAPLRRGRQPGRR